MRLEPLHSRNHHCNFADLLVEIAEFLFLRSRGTWTPTVPDWTVLHPLIEMLKNKVYSLKQGMEQWGHIWLAVLWLVYMALQRHKNFESLGCSKEDPYSNWQNTVIIKGDAKFMLARVLWNTCDNANREVERLDIDSKHQIKDQRPLKINKKFLWNVKHKSWK